MFEVIYKGEIVAICENRKVAEICVDLYNGFAIIHERESTELI